MKNIVNKLTIIGVWRYIFAILSSFIVIIEPALPVFYICVACIMADCYTAWSLSRRVKKKYGAKMSSGKFKSVHAGKVIVTIIKSFVAIVLAFFIQKHIIGISYIDLTKIVAGSIIGWQVWSILENESSCNDAKWAILAQKIMVDKTERHFDVDLSILKDTIKKEEENNG